MREKSMETVTISKAEYEQMQAHITELEKQVELLMEAIRLSRQKRFGVSSEKINGDGMEQLSLLFNEAEVYTDTEEQSAKEEEVPVAAHKRRKKHEYTLDELPENVPVEVVEHRLPEEERVCPECGETMEEIGKEVTRRLKLIPARVVVQEDWYYTYACRNCEKNGIGTPVVKTPREKAVIPGSFATPEAIAQFMVQKFMMGVPLYRQEQELKLQGIPLSRQTMSNWLLKASEMYLEPVYEELHRELLTHEVLHADETELQVLREPGKKAETKSYIWLYRTGRDAEHPIVLYEYQPSRSQSHPKAFLDGFNGYLHTDGYAGYHGLPKDIIVVGCWAHARRYFDEAMRSLPKGKAKGGAAAQGLAYCSLLFRLEQGLEGLPPEERYKQRLEQEKPVLEALFAWAETRNAAPKSALGKALHYLQEQRPYLMNILLDGRLELSNNRAERSIKPFVIDRKNFLFANTPRGAKGSAVIFSLIETAKENGLDPYRYLVWMMKAPLGIPARELTPAHAPEECRKNR